jgi:hypothetical protein
MSTATMPKSKSKSPLKVPTAVKPVAVPEPLSPIPEAFTAAFEEYAGPSCWRCLLPRLLGDGMVHQPCNGRPLQPLCERCAYLFQVALRHSGHNPRAAVEICNVEGLGQLDY